jgi:hypothetical protein
MSPGGTVATGDEERVDGVGTRGLSADPIQKGPYAVED